MSDTKISALTALLGASIATDDEFVVVDTSGSETKRITAAELMAAISTLGLGSNPLTVGLFTSAGIDDNATVETLEIEAGFADWGNSTIANGLFGHRVTVNDQYQYITGGNTLTAGASIILYGGAHASTANDMGFRADNANWLYWDDSAATATLSGDLVVEGKLNLDANTELTIASGAVTITHSYHSIDTESDAASDDLDTINGGASGDLLVIRAHSDARTVVAKDGTGNLALNGDFSMTHSSDTLMLLNNGSVWLELSRSDNAA